MKATKGIWVVEFREQNVKERPSTAKWQIEAIIPYPHGDKIKLGKYRCTQEATLVGRVT